MKTTIHLPYPQADLYSSSWASSEGSICFRRQPMEAARCTLSFAAAELCKFLPRTVEGIFVQIAGLSGVPWESGGEDGCHLYLEVEDASSISEIYRWEPTRNGLRIIGRGRTGTLYGVYDFLKLQGWYWLSPEPQGEFPPAKKRSLVFPKAAVVRSPSFDLGRGFDSASLGKESVPLLLWMARNRLNTIAWGPATGPLAQKLGMQFKNGGHIFEEILHPDRCLANGATLWETHPEWYGLPPDGKRVKEAAQKTQFCCSNEDLLTFLGEELVARLETVWKEADRLDMWGFDTWGSTCSCAGCRALGSSTDQILHFLARMREAVDQACHDGRLAHPVRLIVCGYEGTATIDGPGRPVPENLTRAGDLVVFYPIRRCYAHDFGDRACFMNAAYDQSLKSWLQASPSLGVVMGEYYNVSKFEDLPLLFTQRLANDWPYYYALGVRGATYMHVPLINWGIRTLTQYLYAELTWDVEADVPSLVEACLQRLYGKHCDTMREVCRLTEEAWQACADWRSWGPRSVLSTLLSWDGARPPPGLAMDNHFVFMATAAKSGQDSLATLRQALSLVEGSLRTQRRISARAVGETTKLAVNPLESSDSGNEARIEYHLGEARRALLYGVDTLMVMTLLCGYHQALADENHAEANRIWEQLVGIEDRLDGYYFPIEWVYPGPGIVGKDALSRSQVGEVLRRCRHHRIQSGLEA